MAQALAFLKIPNASFTNAVHGTIGVHTAEVQALRPAGIVPATVAACGAHLARGHAAQALPLRFEDVEVSHRASPQGRAHWINSWMQSPFMDFVDTPVQGRKPPAAFIDQQVNAMDLPAGVHKAGFDHPRQMLFLVW
jgi:hypothetical protein